MQLEAVKANRKLLLEVHIPAPLCRCPKQCHHNRHVPISDMLCMLQEDNVTCIMNNINDTLG